jgi:hypothetical protein
VELVPKLGRGFVINNKSARIPAPFRPVVARKAARVLARRLGLSRNRLGFQSKIVYERGGAPQQYADWKLIPTTVDLVLPN